MQSGVCSRTRNGRRCCGGAVLLTARAELIRIDLMVR